MSGFSFRTVAPRARAGLKRLRAWRPVNGAATRLVKALSRGRREPPNWAVKRLPRVGPVASRLPDGGWLRLDSRGDEWVPNQVFWREWSGYEPECSSLFYDLARTSRVTLDIGAHVGFYALLAAHANPDGRVFAFEPVPETARRLRANVALNGVSNLVAVEAAVSDHGGTAQLVVGPAEVPCSSSLSAHQMRFNPGSRIIEVQTLALEVYLDSRGERIVDLIKIDVEGTEPAALGGLGTALASCRPAILCEVLPDAGTSDALRALLAPLGYRFFHLGPRGPTSAAEIVGDPKWLNWLFVDGDRAAVIDRLRVAP